MKKVLMLLAVSFPGFAEEVAAQDSTQPGQLVLTGSLDGYYRYNFQHAGDAGHTNNLTSFTNTQNALGLGMASLKAEYTSGKTGAVVDLGWGPRAEDFSYNDHGTLASVKQAYLFYRVLPWLKMTAGKWFTPVGYEVPDAYNNRNYSMAYLFTYGPFFHTGIKADMHFSAQWEALAGICGPTDYTTASLTKPFLVVQLHRSSPDTRTQAYLNYLGGKELTGASVHQEDLVVSTLLSGQVSLGANVSVKTARSPGPGARSWWGTALYITYDPVDALGVTLRAEYFDDSGKLAGLGTRVGALTLSGNIHLGPLTLIPEIRMDQAAQPVFFGNKDQQLPSRKTTGTVLLAMVYHLTCHGKPGEPFKELR
ncbi:MAG TPA: outer membrane beta-barrel protein [Chitinophagaceae bacterium]|nr:outer membrane beta-barrel protein [Chitinophagaceae bacterium]